MSNNESWMTFQSYQKNVCRFKKMLVHTTQWHNRWSFISSSFNIHFRSFFMSTWMLLV